MKGLKPAVFGITVLAVLAFAGVGAGVASSGSSVRVAAVASGPSALGRIVVDSRGHTLYLFEKDRRGASACSGACLVYWPPLVTSGAPTATKGARPSLLGSIRRADGTRQVTYAGHPLYRFSGDARRGQTNGEGLKDFGAGWYVLMPSGKKIDRD
jgi:predicted lipoprotein with Yx(FWY)xxD motif